MRCKWWWHCATRTKLQSKHGCNRITIINNDDIRKDATPSQPIAIDKIQNINKITQDNSRELQNTNSALTKFQWLLMDICDCVSLDCDLSWVSGGQLPRNTQHSRLQQTKSSKWAALLQRRTCKSFRYPATFPSSVVELPENRIECLKRRRRKLLYTTRQKSTRWKSIQCLIDDLFTIVKVFRGQLVVRVEVL